MNDLSILSVAQLRRAADIKEQIEELQSSLENMLAGPVSNGHEPVKTRRGMPESAKKKLARAMRKRWRLAKKNGRNGL